MPPGTRSPSTKTPTLWNDSPRIDIHRITTACSVIITETSTRIAPIPHIALPALVLVLVLVIMLVLALWKREGVFAIPLLVIRG